MKTILNRDFLLNTLRTIKLVFSSAGIWSFYNIILTIIQGSLPLANIYLMKVLIDKITESSKTSFDITDLSGVFIIVFIIVFVYLLSGILSSLGNYIREQQSLRVSDNMYNIIQKKALELDLEYFENSAYHDKFYRAINEAPYRPVSIVNNIIRVFQNGISLLLMSGLLFFLHWSLGLVIILATLPGLYIRLRYSKMTYQWQQSKTQNERKAAYFNRIITDVDFAKEIRLFGLGELFIERFRHTRKELREEKLKISKKAMITETITQIVSNIAVFLCYIYIVYKTVKGNITTGEMVMYLLAFQRGLGFLRDTLGGFANIYEDNLFVNNLYEFLKLKPKITCKLSSVSFPLKIEKEIRFENVSFAYPESTRNVLSNVSLTIPAGKTVALVGKNGAGKTTLIKLLCRLYNADKGKILIDGKDVTNIDPHDLRKNISVIFQDFVLYNLPAEENIWFGDISKPIDNESIRGAAANAGVDQLLSGLKDGYKTMLGNLFEGSEELSIGEWQRIALARAFFKNSSLIVLDEPTSSMDADSEFEIFNHFREITRGKTSLIVSHRFSTIKLADYIYVLDEEKVIEEGTHDELMKQNSHYAEMYNKQAQNYIQ
ncbi:MAG: ABC transporter ATP-binding protein [Bacteroidota bacterium]|nr:ABC transporter ATP-binding protein [Bacteroidota bacterium]